MVDASDKNNYRFVTARGWEDLSEMMQLYEESGILVDHALAAQYVQNPEFSKGFAEYYDRFNYYREKYDVDAILEGGITAQNIADARAAGTEEAVALMNLLMDGITYTMRSCIQMEKMIRLIHPRMEDILVTRRSSTGYSTIWKLILISVRMREEITKTAVLLFCRTPSTICSMAQTTLHSSL